ncbi:MAG: DUF2007 domain-containing protein [Prevotellaceae bacterium]|jgi:hypothetical protein|nr:DUF2007 domain-containing protein [Prevotellaceae bacterium]
MDSSRTVVLMVLHSMPQAKIIKGLLEANNIECFLSTETTVFGTFFSDNSSIKLYVMEKDYSAAKELLMGSWQEESL